MSATWNIDPAHTSVGFMVRHMVVAKVRGRFAKFGGTVSLDEANLEKTSFEVTIETASIDTGVADRDTHLKSADFLDAASYPSISYKSKGVEKHGDGYQVKGDLTIKDVTREVTLDVEVGSAGKDPWGNERLACSATTSFDRKDFGLKWNQVLEAGGVLVGDKVSVEIDLQLVKGK